jgi:GT2 family glycosyltransferase
MQDPISEQQNLVARYGVGGIRTDEGYHYFVDNPRSWTLGDFRTKVSGWCVSLEKRKLTGIRALWQGGEAIGRYGEPRPDVTHAFGLRKEMEKCGFRLSVKLPVGKTALHLQVCDEEGRWHELAQFNAKVPRYLALPFWPRARSTEDPAENYQSWIEHYEQPNRLQMLELKRRARSLPHKPLISVLLPTYNTPRKWLTAAIESVRRQTYSHWELCISDDGSSNPEVRQVLDSYVKRDSRIRVTYRDVNGHISASSNSALALARGEFVALLDHDDELPPYALYAVALELNRSPCLDLIYGDEDKIDEHGGRYDPYFKSDWNPDLLTAQNCISHLGAFRTERLREIGGFQEGVEGCQDWDIALRITEGIPASRIRHIPRVLYHWRAIPGSTALALEEKNYIDRTGRKMLTEHFERLGVSAAVTPVEGGHWRIKYAITSEPLVTIIIPTRNQARLLRRCLESIDKKTAYRNYELLIVDNRSNELESISYLSELRQRGIKILNYTQPFNYSAINNAAVKEARGDLVCFLNNDMEVITPEWLEEMVSHALRPEIGAVGAKLYFPDETLQHIGIILGLGGPAGHVLYKFNGNTGGYYNRARLVCNYSAVTAACMMVRKSVFVEVGGFDQENLPVSYNDVDLCLRILAAGYRNLYTPFAQFYHHESASRGEDASRENRARSQAEIEYMWKRWGQLLLRDPGYNPNLSLQREDYSLAAPPRLKPIWEESALDEPETPVPAISEMPGSWKRVPKAPKARIDRVSRSASEMIAATYQRLLGRAPDARDLQRGSAALRSGVTLQMLIAELAKSAEFRNGLAPGSDSLDETVQLCYDRLLARVPHEGDVRELTKVARKDGWDAAVEQLVYSHEFNNRFGVYTVPFPTCSPETKLTWDPSAIATK